MESKLIQGIEGFIYDFECRNLKYIVIRNWISKALKPKTNEYQYHEYQYQEYQYHAPWISNFEYLVMIIVASKKVGLI